MKKGILILILAFVLLIGAFIIFLGRETADQNRKIYWGVTFSPLFAQELGIDWRGAYLEILNDLKIKKIRLIAYWPEIEPKPGEYNFSDLDWQVSEAANRGAEVILAVGQKLPRWPECHYPIWLKGGDNYKKEELLKYIEETISHYKNNTAITIWEVENEPFLNFGECPPLDVDFLDREIALVRKLDSRPIMITDSGELSFWIRAAKRSDIFGTTMYRYVWHKLVGSYKYPIPPGFFRAKERITRFFVGQEKPFVVIELQGEPWHNKQIWERTTEEQLSSLSLENFKSLIAYAKKGGFSQYYLWGAEWWYLLKQNGHTEFWEYVKNLIAENQK